MNKFPRFAGFAATSLGTRIVDAQTERNKGAPGDAVDQMQTRGRLYDVLN